MRNIILPFLILGTLFSVNFTFAQKCGTYDGFLEEQALKYPEFYESIEAKNAKIEVEYEKALSRLKHAKTENGVKIIPVVVHVIHDMGNENISDESIQGAIDILNANINGQASNFLNKTPDVFATEEEEGPQVPYIIDKRHCDEEAAQKEETRRLAEVLVEEKRKAEAEAKAKEEEENRS